MFWNNCLDKAFFFMAGIFGIGVDIVDIQRIAEMRKRQGDRFYDLLFTRREVEYALARANSDECFAARFAAKEAVMKALGTGWAEGVAFTGIEIIRQDDKRPEVVLHGGASEKAKALGIGKIHLSISHAKETAVAYAIAEMSDNKFENI